MKKVFNNVWLQLLTATVLSFGAMFDPIWGALLYMAYFSAWIINKFYNEP